MAYSWDNRVNFLVRFMYDTDNNGFLDKSDFECLAVRNTVMEGKGQWCQDKFECNREIMENLWNEIARLADFDSDGQVSVEEFKLAMASTCKNKSYDELPQPFKFFIDRSFRSIDVDRSGTIGIEEYRLSCVKRLAYKSVVELDEAYSKLLNEEDKKKGGITLERYQELYAEFIGSDDDNTNACFLFGPLPNKN